MRRLRGALVGLLAMLVWAGGGPGAFALDSAGVAAVTASGSMSPGLSTPGLSSPATQTVSFGGTAIGQFSAGTSFDAGQCTVAFVGTETDTAAQAAGTGSLWCNGTGFLGHAIAIACSVSYSRVATTVAMTGSCSGSAGGLLAVSAQWLPDNVNPTTAFSLVGSGAIGTGSVVVTGSGNVSPGVGAGVFDPGVFQNVSYSGTAVGAFGTTAGSCALSATGSGTHSFTLGGEGGTLTCSSGVINESCTYSLLRVGVAYVVVGSCSGTATGRLAGAGVFVPSNTSPTTDFTLAGEFQIAPV